MEYINEFHKQWIERTRKSIENGRSILHTRRNKEAAGTLEPTERDKRD